MRKNNPFLTGTLILTLAGFLSRLIGFFLQGIFIADLRRRGYGHLSAPCSCHGTFLFPDSRRDSDCHFQIYRIGDNDTGLPDISSYTLRRIPSLHAPVHSLHMDSVSLFRLYSSQLFAGKQKRLSHTYLCPFHSLLFRTFSDQRLFLWHQKSRNPCSDTDIGTDRTCGKCLCDLWLFAVTRTGS